MLNYVQINNTNHIKSNNIYNILDYEIIMNISILLNTYFPILKYHILEII